MLDPLEFAFGLSEHNTPNLWGPFCFGFVCLSYMSPGGLNSSPNACMKSTLLTEPALQPSVFDQSLYFIELLLYAGNPKNFLGNKNCFGDPETLLGRGEPCPPSCD